MKPTIKTLLTFSAFILLLSISESIRAQSVFHMRYGSSYEDRARKAIETNDGNFVVVGRTDGFGSAGNAFIMKVDQSGQIVWVVDYAGINQDEIYDIQELPDGSLVMCGATNSYGFGSVDGFVMKTDSEGHAIWTNVIGSVGAEYFFSLGVGPSGEIYVAGYANVYSESFGYYLQGTLTGRLDGDGNVEWLKWFDNWTPMADNLHVDMVALSAGGMAVCMPGTAIQVSRLSQTGDVEFSGNYNLSPTSAGLAGYSVTEDLAGNILLYYSGRNNSTAAESLDACVIRMNSMGSVISNTSYGGTYVEWTRNISPTSDGGSVLLSHSNSAGNGHFDASLIRLDSEGTLLWAKAYGKEWDDRPWDVIQTSDGGFVFTGQTWSQGTSPDSSKVHLVKTDEFGNSSCNDISWFPQTAEHGVSILPGTQPITLELNELFIKWSPQTRQFYQSDFCYVVSTGEIAEVYKFDVYPNPAFEILNISSTLLLDNSAIALYDISGKQVSAHTRISGYEASVYRGSLPAGMYLLSITGDGITASRYKVIFTD